MNRQRKIGILLLFTVIMAGLLMVSGCGGPGKQAAQSGTPDKAATDKPQPTEPAKEAVKPAEVKAATPKPVKVLVAITSPILEYLAFFMGIENGYFQEEGLEVDTQFLATSVVPAAMVSGDVQFTAMSRTTVAAALKGMPFKLVGGNLRSMMFSLISRPEFREASQLKGKNIGIMEIGSAEHIAVRAALSKLGLNSDQDVVYVKIASSTPTRVAALESGAIQAAPMSPPFSFELMDKGYNELSFTGDVVEIPYVGLGTTDSMIKEQPAQVKGLLKGLLKSYKYILENKAESIAFMSKQYKVDATMAERLYGVYTRLLLKDGYVSEKGINTIIDMVRKDVGLGENEKVDLARVSDFSLLQQAHRELGW